MIKSQVSGNQGLVFDKIFVHWRSIKKNYTVLCGSSFRNIEYSEGFSAGLSPLKTPAYFYQRNIQK